MIAFYGAALLLSLSPGPDNLFVLMQSMQRGWRVGMAVVVGLLLGVLCHTVAVALGLAAVVAASPMAFDVLKWCGAAYLLYLAWGAWRAPVQAAEMESAARAVQPLSVKAYASLVLRGVVMNVTNPKVLIFFLAFLPQFADPARGHVAWQVVVLGITFILAALPVFGGLAIFSGVFGQWLMGSVRAQWWLNKITSVVFVGLALRLATVQKG